MVIDIVLFRTMGDILMGTVIVNAIKEKYPDSYIRFHTDSQYAEILAGNPQINDIIAVPSNNYMQVYEYLLEANPKSDHICRLAMANHFDTLWHHTEEIANQHMIDWYASRSGLDLKIRNYNVRIGLPDTYVSLPTTKYIVMHTTSLLESKNWPIQYFNHLAQMLKDKYPDYSIVQIGGPTDKPIEGAISLLGKTNVKQSNIIINNALCYIGIDSGSSYLAGAAGIPTFIIMGASMGRPQAPNQAGPLVGPVGPNVHYIEPNRPTDSSCRPIPCINHCVLKAPCINTIEPSIVMEAIENEVQDLPEMFFKG